VTVFIRGGFEIEEEDQKRVLMALGGGSGERGNVALPKAGKLFHEIFIVVVVVEATGLCFPRKSLT
jgi:hypothetical protein